MRMRHAERRGALTVEFAITLPVAILFFWGAFECSRANVLLHTIENACYEGARAAIVPGAVANDARQRAQSILDIVGTRSATITITPDPLPADAAQVTVQISVPLDANNLVTPRFFSGRSFTESITLDREAVQ